MNRLSLPAIALFLFGAIGASYLKDVFFVFDGPAEFLASAGFGATGGLIGAMIGMIIFPKNNDEQD